MTSRIASMPNFRDAGGHRTAGGYLRRGLLFRSDQLGGLSREEGELLSGLGLKVVYDLRTDAERSMLPEARIPGATHVPLDVLADDRQSLPARLLRLLVEPESAEPLLGNGRGAAMFLESYRSYVRMPSARLALGRLYSGLADPDSLPALCHCTTGKDRTGWACAALQTLLGVPYDDVLADYLASNRFVLPRYQPHVDAFAARGGDPMLLMPILCVRPEYLEASFDEVRREFGSIEGYFRDGLGITDGTIAELRSRFVGSSPSERSGQ
jgi:protein-tyrosine phosphatase